MYLLLQKSLSNPDYSHYEGKQLQEQSSLKLQAAFPPTVVKEKEIIRSVVHFCPPQHASDHTVLPLKKSVKFQLFKRRLEIWLLDSKTWSSGSF